MLTTYPTGLKPKGSSQSVPMPDIRPARELKKLRPRANAQYTQANAQYVHTDEANIHMSTAKWMH